jgi:hypothetical protein
MLYMFHTHVVIVCSKYFISFRYMFAFKHFMVQMFHVLEDIPGAGGRGAARLGSCRRGALVLILSPGSWQRGERYEGVKEKA